MNKFDRFVIKWFLGSTAVIDERTKSELGMAAIRAAFAFFVFEMLFALGSTIYLINADVENYENTLYVTMLIQIIMTFAILIGFISIPLAKKKLGNKEISPGKKKKTIKTIKNYWIKMAPMEFLLYWLVSVALNTNKNNFLDNLFSLDQITDALIFTVIFSIFMYLKERRSIHVVKDDK